jgi:hypothetical protein
MVIGKGDQWLVVGDRMKGKKNLLRLFSAFRGAVVERPIKSEEPKAREEG